MKNNFLKFLRKKILGKRGDLEMETLIKWIIVIVALVLILFIVFIFNQKGTVILDKLKGIFMTRG
jgi:hypothetical protein